MQNFESDFEKIKDIVQCQSGRQHELLGRVLNVNTLMVPMLHIQVSVSNHPLLSNVSEYAETPY